MELHDSRNVQRVLRMLGREWGRPVWMVRRMIQESIDYNWEAMQSDPEAKALWEKYFPYGKPTAEQYVGWLGKAHEHGEEMPYLLKDKREKC